MSVRSTVQGNLTGEDQVVCMSVWGSSFNKWANVIVITTMRTDYSTIASHGVMRSHWKFLHQSNHFRLFLVTRQRSTNIPNIYLM